ncbi:MAG: PLP-dependent aminotransferase family protein [Sulfitobacter sp.]
MGTIWRPQMVEGSGPKYKIVVDMICEGIASGQLNIGDKLPPVRELAWQLGITPGTVARSYTILVDAGTLEAEVGRGTFVAPPKTDVPEDIWSRLTKPVDSDKVALFSPRLPDMGQVAAIRKAMVQVAQCPDEEFLNYPTRDAYRPARKAVVDWLTGVSLGTVSESDVVLSHGGQNAISLVLQATLTGAKPVLLVEDLSYAGFRRAAEILRADVTGVAMDDLGVIPGALEHAIRSSGAQVFCTSPEVQNPTVHFTPLERRQELAAICKRLGVQILEDDCYRMGEAKAPSYRALLPSQAWYVSSISKTLTPALRIGYAVAPVGRGADLRRSAEYGFFGLAHPIAELARIILSDPNSRAISVKVRQRLAAYVEVTVNTLGGFDLTWDKDVPFVWLKLPAGWRAAAFCRAAEAQGVQIRSADEFALRDGRAPNAVRIAMNGHVTLQSFEAAMQRLARLLDNPPEQISV